MSEFGLQPHATTAPFMPTVVALAAATAKTTAQVATPSTTDILVCGWGVSFDGATGTNTPVICQLIQTDVAATGLTAQSPELRSSDLLSASLCVSGTSATGHGGGVTPTEGTITAVRVFDQQHVHPQSGYGVLWQGDDRFRIPPSRFLRLRCQAPQAVNVLPWILWNEPAT